MSFISTDDSLQSVYRTMFGLSNINNITGGTLFSRNTSCMGKIYVTGNTIINNNILFYKNNILYDSLITNNITTKSINIKNDSYINNNLTLNSSLLSNDIILTGSLNISNNTIYNYFSTVLSNINNNKNLIINNKLSLNNLQATTGSQINLNSDIINIGNTTSIISFFGTNVSVILPNITISDNIFSLNINPTTLSGFDTGFMSGIEIKTTGSTGFINSDENSKRYYIKAPNNNNGYILDLNNNNNIVVSGRSIIYNNISLLNNFSVNNLTNNSLFLTNNLQYSNSLINGSMIINNSAYITNNNIILGNTTIYNNLNIQNVAVLINNSTVNNNLSVFNNSIITKISSLELYCNNIYPNTYNVNNIYINKNMITNNNITINNQLLVTSNVIIKNNLYVSNLSILANSVLNNNITLNNILYVSNTCAINRSLFLGTKKTNTLNVLSNIILPLTNEYKNNNDASQGGITIGSWYRTGGILKLRVNDIQPSLIFSTTQINIFQADFFIEDGTKAFDTFGISCPVSITSIGTGTSNILNNSITIYSNISITAVSKLKPGSYTITYTTSDSDKNTNTLSRSLIVSPSPTVYIDYIIDIPLTTSSIAISALQPIRYNSTTKYYNWYPVKWEPYTITNNTPNITTSGINTSNVFWSYKQSATPDVPQVELVQFVTANSFVIPYTMSITPSYSLLQSVNFSFLSSWCFVTKIKRLTTANDFPIFVLGIDYNTYYWVPLTGDGVNPGGDLSGASPSLGISIHLENGNYAKSRIFTNLPNPINYTISVSGTIGNLASTTRTLNYQDPAMLNFVLDYNSVQWLTNGFFLSIGYNYPTKTTTITFFDNSGTNKGTVTFTTPTLYQYRNSVNGIPFYINSGDAFKFYDGIIYSINPSVPYSKILSSFPSGNTFN